MLDWIEYDETEQERIKIKHEDNLKVMGYAYNDKGDPCFFKCEDSTGEPVFIKLSLKDCDNAENYDKFRSSTPYITGAEPLGLFHVTYFDGMATKRSIGPGETTDINANKIKSALKMVLFDGTLETFINNPLKENASPEEKIERETQAARYSLCLLLGIRDLARRGFASHDIKPENCVIYKQGDSSYLKITDFDVAQRFREKHNGRYSPKWCVPSYRGKPAGNDNDKPAQVCILLDLYSFGRIAAAIYTNSHEWAINKTDEKKYILTDPYRLSEDAENYLRDNGMGRLLEIIRKCVAYDTGKNNYYTENMKKYLINDSIPESLVRQCNVDAVDTVMKEFVAFIESRGMNPSSLVPQETSFREYSGGETRVLCSLWDGEYSNSWKSIIKTGEYMPVPFRNKFDTKGASADISENDVGRSYVKINNEKQIFFPSVKEHYGYLAAYMREEKKVKIFAPLPETVGACENKTVCELNDKNKLAFSIKLNVRKQGGESQEHTAAVSLEKTEVSG